MNEAWTSPVAAPMVPLPDTAEEAHVLIVEDDPVLRSTLAYALSREGFRVHVAATGESGLEVARKELSRLGVIVLACLAAAWIPAARAAKLDPMRTLRQE